jgi:hypothetical protein
VGWVMLAGHPVLQDIYQAWVKQEDYFPELTGEQLRSYYENLSAGLTLPVVPQFEKDEKNMVTFLVLLLDVCTPGQPYDTMMMK